MAGAGGAGEGSAGANVAYAAATAAAARTASASIAAGSPASPRARRSAAMRAIMAASGRCSVRISPTPSGKVAREPGGWRISGSWGFASGIDNSGWIIVGAFMGMTGTPPRIDGRSIDYSRLQEQPGDGMPGTDGSAPSGPVPVFSFLGHAHQHPRQIPCWITHTNARTHEIIRSGFDRSPMFTGVIAGVGPRYCPSIEDKVVRFAHHDRHAADPV